MNAEEAVEKLSREELIKLAQTLKYEKVRENTRIIDSLYPETGQLSRHNYIKHMEFFAAGKTHMERATISGNRCGKTHMSCYESTLHLTGEYPSWWEGRRFDHGVDWWSASVTGETTRDILQHKFLGQPGQFGTGLIPKKAIIGEPTSRRGLADAVDTIQIKHISGDISTLSFKSFDQGREKFQGTKKDGIQLDEEPPASVYFEALTRLSATEPGQEDGLMLCTFTPLSGMSAVVLMFLNDASSARFVMTMGMDHAPHLSSATKQKLLKSYPPHEREARINGTPQLGAGKIYPVDEVELIVPDFQIPKHWPRIYGFDVGWNKTACIWGAIDRETDIVYLYSEHYQGEQLPVVHAQALKARGLWIPGLIDPASRGKSQRDGQQLMQDYVELGLNLTPAFNGVESGLYSCWERMAGGRLKVFASLNNWREEFRLYRRNEQGKVHKEKDHLMDAMRYMIMGLDQAKAEPVKQKPKIEMRSFQGNADWME
jgi:phage terminase large subunit-like protein